MIQYCRIDIISCTSLWSKMYTLFVAVAMDFMMIVSKQNAIVQLPHILLLPPTKHFYRIL